MNQKSPDADLFLQFIASLTLADHLGEVAGDILYVLRKIGFDVGDACSLDEIRAVLARHGVTTLYGTSLSDDPGAATPPPPQPHPRVKLIIEPPNPHARARQLAADAERSAEPLRPRTGLKPEAEGRTRTRFRGVVWPRQLPAEAPVAGPYRYAIVGLLVTEEPLARFAENEHPLDGHAPGLGEALAQIAPGRPPCKLGDATEVLLGLDTWQRSESTEGEAEVVARLDARFEAMHPKWHRFTAETVRRYPKKVPAP